LTEIHSKDFVHHDLHSGNILVNKKNSTLIADLGLFTLTSSKKLVSIEKENKAKKNSTTIKKPIKSKELSRSRQASIERMKGQRKIDQMLQELNSKLMKQRAMLGRVKEMIDSISFMFEVSGKNVMYLGELVTKLKESTSSPLEVMEHIELLAEVAPDWFKVTLARDSKKVVTIDGSYQLKKLEQVFCIIESPSPMNISETNVEKSKCHKPTPQE
ncbi:3110_t:CDS:2, partial [Entrophospora sp. SA101]